MSEPSVFIVDDDPAVRKALSLLAKSAGLNAKTYASGYEFLNSCTPDVTGCLVLDVRMPGLDGLELQEILAARRIGLPIVFITGHGDIRTSVRAMKSGGVDFLEKPFDDEELLDSIRNAMDLDARRRQQRERQIAFQARAALLTPRESEVMALLVDGMHTKQIAASLGISVKTVDKHKAKVLSKMQADTVVELVRLALTSGATHHLPHTP